MISINDEQKEFAHTWIRWLDSEIRQKVLSDWEKQNKRELKEFLESLVSQ